jgi:hypothetical protein
MSLAFADMRVTVRATSLFVAFAARRDTRLTDAQDSGQFASLTPLFVAFAARRDTRLTDAQDSGQFASFTPRR